LLSQYLASLLFPEEHHNQGDDVHMTEQAITLRAEHEQTEWRG